MRPLVRVAHDFACPWCWVGWHQAKRLREEFGCDIEWLSHEMHPDDAPLPAEPVQQVPTRRPPIPSRVQLAFTAEGLEPLPAPRPEGRSHNAHEAVRFAAREGVDEALIGAIYRAWWIEGRPYNNPEELERIANGFVKDLPGMLRAVETRQFQSEIVKFDLEAYEKGTFYVPTFFINGQAYAEQPYPVIRAAMVEWLGEPHPYAGINFPEPPPDRPYVFMNMVATIDGKTISGKRDEAVMDLGSEVDHKVMRRLELAADGVLIGAGSLRATKGLWYPSELWRFVATRSSNIPNGRFFTDAPTKAGVFYSDSVPTGIPDGVHFLKLEGGWSKALARLRNDFGIKTLLVEGGSELNAEFLREDLVDEMFLTVAPKIKLGRDVPTYAGGEPLARNALLNFTLLEQHRVKDEIFLRYRRNR